MLFFFHPMQELAALRAHLSSSNVNVEVDAAPQQDLAQILSEVRSQYEGIAEKNRREMEAWYKVKVRHGGKLTHQDGGLSSCCVYCKVVMNHSVARNFCDL